MHRSHGAAAGLTAVAMLAFAANSLLCRLALQQDRIDPASFGAVRLLAGALVLAVVMRARRQPVTGSGNWRSAGLLFAYVALFSFAYVSLPAGTGALILFGAVQLTMLGAGLLAGERFAPAGWLGLALASAGLAVLLLLPGAAAPSLFGAALMAGAGVAWGGYSLRGRGGGSGGGDPLAATAASFVRAAPMGVLLALLFVRRAHADVGGVALAIASGALTSGLGYVVWYAALRRLSALRAAVVQLSVPLIAAVGGVLLLGEAFTLRLGVSALAILGGVALVLSSRASGKAR